MSAYFASLNRGARATSLAPAAVWLPAAPAPAALVGPQGKQSSVLYARLRERLLVAANGHPLRAIVFAGCSGGEGASEIMREFGETLAASGFRVLLLDIQQRHVAAAGSVDLTQMVARDWLAPAASFGRGPITVVTSEDGSRDKEQFYRSPELESWVKSQRARYDYLLFAAPPVGRFADATLLGRLCDGVVLVIEAGETRRAALVGAREQLQGGGVRVIGAVLNHARDDVPARLRPYFPEA